MQDALLLLKSPRPWREIAEELLREPSTERMHVLMKELTKASEDQRLALDEN
jgi:hypothetical protein